MKLENKAFLIMFCGVAMFFCLTVMPVMYIVDDKLLKLHDAQWFMAFTVALVFISAIIAGASIFVMDTDKDKRLVELQLAIHDGQKFMLYWNPLGWAFLLAREMFAWALVVYLAVCVLFVDEDNGGPFD